MRLRPVHCFGLAFLLALGFTARPDAGAEEQAVAPTITDAVPTAAVQPAVRVTPRAPTLEERCAIIHQEVLRQGGTEYEAQMLAEYVAYRETLCQAMAIHDNDDWTYSRFGLNGLTQGLRDEYVRLCGADVRVDTKDLALDVKCALAVHYEYGFRQPWRYVPSSMEDEHPIR
jgi:hypothetical protein